jgi:hypothetical protein
LRTLIVGISLPNASFDNASFLSAPSFSEYSRVLAEMASVAKSVQDAVDGSPIAVTFGGQAVVNGSASAHAFPLRDLLEMRRREAEWVLRGNGLLAIIGHPVANVPGIDGLTGWTNYSWLPEPEGGAFSDLLQPGFGREGAVLTDADHAFAPYVSELAGRIGYRVTADEEGPVFGETGRVFARSPGGAAIGFQMPAGGGTIVVLPAINNPDKDRQQIAGAMVECLARWNGSRTSADTESRMGAN